MKKYSIILVFLSLFTVTVFIGCGGGSGGGDAPSDSSGEVVSGPEIQSVAELFPEVDIENLLANPPTTIVRTTSSNAVIETTYTKRDRVDVNQSTIFSATADNSVITFSSMIDSSTLKVGLPLFVDGVFKGVIGESKASGSNLVVTLEDAKNISDIYESFDVMFQNDAIARSLQRSISSQKIKGKYDYLNKNPLKISVVKKSTGNARSLTNDELILRIDIPKGYATPIEPREITCDFWNAECSLTTQGDNSQNVNLGKSYGKSGLTFSTEGSYIEIGIGTYLRAHYDYNYIGYDNFDFDLAQSAYFQANLSVSVSGELEKKWEAPLKLIDDFTVEILHPHSAVAKTTVIISPQIVFGVNGKIKGTVTATTSVKRSGDVRIKFDSKDGSHSFNHTISDTPKDITKDSVTLSIEAEGNAYIFPAITMTPALTFARIGPSITMVQVRSGIKLNNNINGKIETGFIVENEGEIAQSIAIQASMTTSLQGLVQGLWFIRISPLTLSDMDKCYDFTDVTDLNGSDVEEISNKGEKDACFILYQTKEFKDIFATEKLNILEWKAELLNTPTVEVEKHPGDDFKRDITFKIDINESIEPKIHFYYTLDGKDIPTEGIETHIPVWKFGDMPIEVEKNTKVKVKAVLYNKDVSKSIWSWGTSLSLEAEKLVSLINEPSVTPTSRSFEDSLWISMTQDQGYEIMYQLDNAAAVKYASSINIEKDTKLVVYARDEVDGVKVYSQERTYEYDMCEEDEKLENGECVVKEDEEDDSDLSTGLDCEKSPCSCIYDESLYDSNNKPPNSATYWVDNTACTYEFSLRPFKLRAAMPYLNGERHGTYEGFYYRYEDAGKIQYRSEWLNDERNGKSMYFRPSGEMTSCYNYVNGVKKDSCMP